MPVEFACGEDNFVAIYVRAYSDLLLRNSTLKILMNETDHKVNNDAGGSKNYEQRKIHIG